MGTSVSPCHHPSGTNMISPGPCTQGLTLVHFSAQLKRILRDRVRLVVLYGVFGRCQRVLGSIRGCSGCILCRKRLKSSCEVDECKPLPAPHPSAPETSSPRTWSAGTSCGTTSPPRLRLRPDISFNILLVQFQSLDPYTIF